MSDISTTTLPVIRAASDSLALLEQGMRLLAEARGAEDVKLIRDKAAAMERYLRQQKYAFKACQDAVELKLRAERRLGELLAEMPKHPPGPDRSHDVTDLPATLFDLGITKMQSHRWQRVAGLPEDVFEAEIAAGRRRGDLNTNALLKLAGREVKQREHDEARQRMVEAAPPCDLIRVGDFRDALGDLTAGSVDLIFTDPPYPNQHRHLYGDVAELAARVLKPGGSLVAYCPSYAVADVLCLMTPHIDFWSLIVVKHSGTHSHLNHYRLIASCKPLLWFVKGRYEGGWVCNLIHGERPDKVAHEWAQGEAEATYCIEKMTTPAGLVLDPMCGSGTTLRAALFLGRQVLGCEIAPDRAKVAAVRCDLRAEAASFNPRGWTPWRRAVWLGLTGPNSGCGAVAVSVTSCQEDFPDEEPQTGTDEDGDSGFEVGNGDDDPEADVAEPRLLVRGNKKVGTGVFLWNLPVLSTCPGKTPSCEANCYADKGDGRWPSVKHRHARNLQATEAGNFVEKVIAELRERGASKVRIHSSGDFFSSAYVRKWLEVAAALPDVKFWFYTRSWRVPTILPELVRLASRSNMRAWFSCDRDSGLPAAAPNVRACWLQIEDEEPPAPEPGQMAIDLVFRTKRKGRNPATRIGLATLCPTYSGLDAAADVTCETCRICFR
jgi:SAM-dependent methyltransferase